MRKIADADLYVPSVNEVQPDGSGFTPVLFEQDDLAFVAVFTAMSRQPKGMASFMMRTGGKHFFLRLPAGYGVIFNPGYDAANISAAAWRSGSQARPAARVAGGRDPG